MAGDGDSEITTAKGREMVNLCDRTGLCLGITWRNGDPTAFLSDDPPQATRFDHIAFGQERLEVAEIETCYELGKRGSSRAHNTTKSRFMVAGHLRDVGAVAPEILLAPAGTMLPCVGR